MPVLLDAKIPPGPIPEKWDRYKDKCKLVNPANKRKFTLLVIGTGLAGSSAAATLAELGYHVKIFCIDDSPRRAHSIAAQGGINAAKNYPADGDSVERLFYDTIKGGDFRAREANTYRLAQVSNLIIDQCVAQGVPFAREYSGYLDNRSFGGAQVSRTFYARGQTGQQLLLGAYSALMRQVHAGNVEIHTRCELQDIVLIDDHAKGIIIRNLFSGNIDSHAGDAVILATGGYANTFFLSTGATSSNISAAWKAHKKGALFANPGFVQIHPTCIPVHGDYQSKLTLMSESLRNDGRIWVPVNKGDNRPPNDIPEVERDYYLERKYPAFGNLMPRDIASRAAKEVCDDEKGVGTTGRAVYLDFADAQKRLGPEILEERYGNLFDMYQRITDHNPYQQPMMIYPASHYSMGGLWVDYNLMTTVPGLFAIGEVNFSDHGANRLGASALMQGLADGYFILPYTIAGYLSEQSPGAAKNDQPEFKEACDATNKKITKILSLAGKRTPTQIHRELGALLWDHCGLTRTKLGLRQAAEQITKLRDEFWQNITVPGVADDFNQTLEKALRTADYLEFASLMVQDALHRNESCGAHFREDHQTPEGEAQRNDEKFCYVAAWQFQGVTKEHTLHKEPLKFEHVSLAQREY
ncbi:MAG: fumarate reductase/succinate dehydrogenase flavoprotein subunit [Planctomycetes bacterium]|nr:fumarate reductase/succinate dehydrogenase flavoprotein subunit [Planctomycetota bacterium]